MQMPVPVLVFFPPITMHLDHQGPPVTYSGAASRPPQRATTSPNVLEMCDMCELRSQLMRKKRRPLKLPSTRSGSRKQEEDEQAALRKEKEHVSSEEFANA